MRRETNGAGMTTARQHGTPGEWAKVRGTVFSLWPLFLCFVALGAFGAAAVLGRHVLTFSSLFMASVVATALFWRKGIRRVESFFKGARGEERVAALLAELPGEYHVFHDFAAGGFHVDHVVVGPSGVFSVETKCWNGKVTAEDGELIANGRLPDRSPLVQSQRESSAVKAALKRAGWDGDVTPVVCFASDTYAGADSRIGAVTVRNASETRGWLAARPATLPPSEVERLAQLMDTCVG